MRSRLTYFVAATLLILGHHQSSGQSLGKLSPRGKRRVVYNSDLSNTTSHMSDTATVKELKAIVRNYAVHGGIDTVVQEVWHQGWSTFWRSKHCEYDSRPQHKKVIAMMDKGIMPIQVYLEACHAHKMEFIAGFRMNDRHGTNPNFFARLKKDHPDWVLGFKPTARGADPRSRRLGCSLNYEKQGVREWIFSIMKEVATRFDVDGIEMNFTRMPEVFRSGVARGNHPIMSRFMRRVRRMLDETGRRKKKRLMLGVRVLQSVEGCRKLGLDVPTWIREGSVNYVAPGDIGFTDYNARYEDFVKIARKHNCFVYPQLENRLSYPRRREGIMTDAQSRAAVNNYFGAGTDGFSTQNFQMHWGEKLKHYPKAMSLLRQLRDPERVKALDRHYVYTPLWGTNGYGPSRTYLPQVVRIPRNKVGSSGKFRFRLCEKLVKNASLTCRPSVVPGDQFTMSVNGHKIAKGKLKVTWSAKGKPTEITFALTPKFTVYGDNYLQFTLLKAGVTKGEVTLSEVEVVVKN